MTPSKRARQAYFSAASKPFQWGSSDCGTAAADAVKAATGFDPYLFFRGHYHDEASFIEMSRSCPLKVLARLAQANEWMRVRSDDSSRVAIGVARGVMAGPAVVMGFDGKWFGRGGLGIMPVRPEKIRLAWRVL